jgi:hypothetical protein
VLFGTKSAPEVFHPLLEWMRNHHPKRPEGVQS